MIRSRQDYLHYRRRDKANTPAFRGLKNFLFNDIWKFQRALRFAEYLHNCKSGVLWKPFQLLAKVRYKALGKKLGYSIPMNVFGPGLMLPHYGNIVVNRHARIGANCKVHVGVNIGAGYDTSDQAPALGDNCYIAPGAKLFGGIVLGNDIKVGANAVVNKSYAGDQLVLVGMPAKPLQKG